MRLSRGAPLCAHALRFPALPPSWRVLYALDSIISQAVSFIMSQSVIMSQSYMRWLPICIGVYSEGDNSARR